MERKKCHLEIWKTFIDFNLFSILSQTPILFLWPFHQKFRRPQNLFKINLKLTKIYLKILKAISLKDYLWKKWDVELLRNQWNLFTRFFFIWWWRGRGKRHFGVLNIFYLWGMIGYTIKRTITLTQYVHKLSKKKNCRIQFCWTNDLYYQFSFVDLQNWHIDMLSKSLQREIVY